ncbi:MAG TPA: tetratricopeptide repeat protein [Gemmataceae bacterium]|jgi:Ca-activated chloride channel family protein
MTTRRPTILFAASLGLAAAALAVATARNPDFWSTPDRRADRLFAAGRFDEAAAIYQDPSRRGAALFRAGNFKDAAAAFAAAATPEAAFDRGNALVMLGKYDDAVKSYDRALALRPGWADAADNRAVAVVRRDRMKLTGGDETGGEEKADRIVFEKGKNPNPGEKTEVAGGDPLTDDQLRALWLRRVQTKPADFLRAKFAYQAQAKEDAQP